ncbi:hypothetical protein RJ639_044799 [Escallonia herrerae]|uniref:Integrase zinc-binding domain-containing protein n=1 Tax=Escallonia herrerae TaxID=1293975 RepID=A0AA89B440_9ASTE|nr:hypothetical protein RJ639_044799 [Escallonia herrerae]
MNIPSDRLRKIDTPLYGFSNHPMVCEGIIALPVAVGTPPAQAKLMLDFVMVCVPSAYNVILGQTALNQLKVVVSTYHMKMKFPTEHDIGEVKGDQVVARQCYMASCRTKSNETLIIEDLRYETKVERGKLAEDLLDNELYPDGVLYKKSFSLPYLKCLSPREVDYALREVHEGICGQHLGGRNLAHKILRQGYYWPGMQKDAVSSMRRCDQCQKFAPLLHTLAIPLNVLTFPIPFAMWGMDILGLFPLATGQRRFVIVAIDYFMKWTEAEPLATITEAKCKEFFGRMLFVALEFPRQTENMNRSILQGLKRKLDEANGTWVDELPKVLWAYRTTPHSVTRETPFLLCFGTEALLPVEVGLPTVQVLQFLEAENEANLQGNLDLLVDVRAQALD